MAQASRRRTVGRWDQAGLLRATEVPMPVSELELSLVRVTEGGVCVSMQVGLI